jgi:PAS domain S-box-containing protein
MLKLNQCHPADSPDHRKRAGQAPEETPREPRRRQVEVSALLEASRAILEYREFQDAARAIFDSCKKLIGATSGYIALLNDAGTENEVLFLDPGGLECMVDPDLPMPIRGLREKVFEDGVAVFDNNFSRSRWTEFLAEGHAKLDNVLFAPLKLEGKTVGLLGIANKPAGFNDHDARMASTFGELAAIALRNSRTLEALESSEQRFRSLTQSANDGIVSIDSSGQVVYWNSAAERMFGYSADEIIGKPLTPVLPGRFREDHQDGMHRVVSTGQSNILGRTVEVVGRRADGSEFPIELSLSTWGSNEGAFFTGILRDITERKQTEQEGGRLAAFPSENPDPVMRAKHDGTLIYANEASLPLLNVWGCEIGQTLPDQVSATLSGVFASRRRADIDVECGDRTIVIRLVPVTEAGYVNLYGRDITERTWARRFLEIVNRHSAMRPLLVESVAEVKRFTGCGAVGIRILNELGGVPYQACDGFLPQFQELESSLSIKTDCCMCISVIKGEIDARLPFYTKGGSFLVNGTTQFLAAVSEEEKGKTRNTCNEFGYESVALVPIRLGDRILGLIHVADPRENAIPREVVQSLERIAMQLGTAIQRVRAEEALRAVNEELETRVKQRTAELEEANRELQTEIAERQRLEKEVLDIGTREQRRIGQELHDGLGQELTGLSYLATSLHRKLRAAVFAETETAADLAEGIPRVLSQVQVIVKGLVPLQIGAEDLVPALQALAANIEERTGISCSFRSDGTVKLRDSDVAVQLYRIVQEAVTNAVKHARAKRIDVAVTADRTQMALEVRDDGVGVPPDVEKASGSGMHIMQYRARVIGATLKISRGPRGGTLVTCRLPREKRDDPT